MSRIESQIQDTVQEYVSRYEIGALQSVHLSNVNLTFRDAWFNRILELFECITAWKKFILKQKLIQWAVNDVVVTLLLPCLSAFPFFEADFPKLEKLVQKIPDEWIESGYTTPPLMRPLEDYAKTVYTNLGIFQDQSIAKRLAIVFSKLNSLDIASKLSKIG
jgi:hypothetical protein